MQHTVRQVALLAAASALAATGAAAARDRAQPNLVETGVSASADSPRAGGTFVASDVVANRGAARAGRFVTAYYLVGPERVRLGDRAVGRLRRGEHSDGERTVTVPASTPPGKYRLVACGDDRNQVSESSEADNCGADEEPIRIRPPARDRTAPRFAGLESAITCIGGPIGDGRKTSYHLSWSAARDNVTPTDRIVYDVYQASRSRKEDFAHPTYTTKPGATRFSTPELTSAHSWFFVVRARDAAGNRDANTVERQGENPCV
jgi:hypothetical protein